MMSSRGMGAINPSKMPGPKRKARRDDTDFDEYAVGGSVRNPRGPGAVDNADAPMRAKGPGSPAGKYSTLLPQELQNVKSKAQSLGLTRDVQEISEEEALRGRLKGYKGGGEVWDKPRPKGLGKPKALTPAKKSKAKAMAKAAGRPYPSLVDNMRAARGK